MWVNTQHLFWTFVFSEHVGYLCLFCLTLTGFSRSQGRWMFLDRSSFNRVHMLLQKLRNLLTLAQWAARQLSSAHLWKGTQTAGKEQWSSSILYSDIYNLVSILYILLKQPPVSSTGTHTAPQMSNVVAGTENTGLWSSTSGLDGWFSGGASWGFCPSFQVRIWSHTKTVIKNRYHTMLVWCLCFGQRPKS